MNNQGVLVPETSQTERGSNDGELSGGEVQIVSVSGDPRPESLSFVTYMTVNVLGDPSSSSVTSMYNIKQAHVTLKW